MSASDVTRSGFVAVAGRPNAGKSTLINQLVGEHVAIVSPIAQTTRRVVRAVVTRDETQIVFVDLPGSQRPVDRLTARMQHAVVQSFGDVDAVLWVIDMTEELGRGEKIVADMVLGANLPVVIAANKTDLVKPHDLLRRIVAISEMLGERDYHALVPISALTGDTCDAIVSELSTVMPEGPAYFPDDELTDMRDSERIAEYVREALLAHMRDELPHATIVSVEDISETDDGRLDLDCIIWVERDSQVGIVVGKGGTVIRDVGIAARAIIEEALDERVHLRLRVKVRKRWRDDDTWLARAGL